MSVPDPAAFFLYGTLMRGQANFDACAGDALTVTPATAVGTLYHLRAGYPIALDTGRDPLVGQIMTFPDPARTLDLFDELEGVDPAAPEDGWYVRVVRDAVPRDGGAPVRCWMYLAPPDRFRLFQPYAVPVPSGDWAAFLQSEAYL